MAKYRITPSSKAIIQLPISIGHKAEKGVEAIEFDLTAWVETYGSGTATIIMRRWGDAIPYPIALEIDENNKATWTLSDTDTAKAGMAYAQLNYIVGDEVVKKSDIYTFRVMDSLTGEGEPPEAYESWLEHLTHLAAEAMAEVLDIEGIVTDKTLTVDGGIADAKAAGDALALKADKSTTYTKSEVDGLIEDVTVETDTTLTIAGAAADAKKVGDELSEIKADLADFAYLEPTLPTPILGWIRYSNGEKVNSQAARLFVFSATGIKRIKAFLASDTAVLCAIAFYTSDGISTDGYMASDSVDFLNGTHNDGAWYESPVPGGCVTIAITSKIPSESVADYKILFAMGYATESKITELNSEIDGINNEIVTINTNLGTYANKNNANLAMFCGRFKPCFDHLFVNRTGDNVIIPHESLYHVRISAKLGFNCIEANTAQTSDGVYFVNHLNNGKFGGFFHHVDGETDISNINASSVTWAWIVENVRYNSTIPKYRTRPCALSEFLYECRQQNIIPFVQANNAEIITIVEKIMGKDNYIAYGATRALAPNAIICHYVTNLTTKADILAYCQNVGVPFIYGMGNASSFSDADLRDIVETLHQNGFWIGISYDDTRWHKYSGMGFDFNGTQYLCNRLTNGNICNFETIFNFNDFTITNGVENDGVVTFASEGSIAPNISATVIPLGIVDAEIEFSGKILLQSRSIFGNYTLENTDRALYFLSAPILNNHPRINIVCYEGATIYGIKFKASRC